MRYGKRIIDSKIWQTQCWNFIGYPVWWLFQCRTDFDVPVWFIKQNDKLCCTVLVKSSYSSTLADFLLERYLIVSEKDGLFLFLNGLNLDTATMAVTLQLYDSSYWQVMYLSSTPSSTRSIRSGENPVDNSVFDELLNQLR